MTLIGERGARLNLMQKWDMNKLYKVGLSKHTVPNELYCSKSGEETSRKRVKSLIWHSLEEKPNDSRS